MDVINTMAINGLEGVTRYGESVRPLQDEKNENVASFESVKISHESGAADGGLYQRGKRGKNQVCNGGIHKSSRLNDCPAEGECFPAVYSSCKKYSGGSLSVDYEYAVLIGRTDRKIHVGER